MGEVLLQPVNLILCQRQVLRMPNHTGIHFAGHRIDQARLDLILIERAGLILHKPQGPIRVVMLNGMLHLLEDRLKAARCEIFLADLAGQGLDLQQHACPLHQQGTLGSLQIQLLPSIHAATAAAATIARLHLIQRRVDAGKLLVDLSQSSLKLCQANFFHLCSSDLTGQELALKEQVGVLQAQTTLVALHVCHVPRACIAVAAAAAAAAAGSRGIVNPAHLLFEHGQPGVDLGEPLLFIHPCCRGTIQDIPQVVPGEVGGVDLQPIHVLSHQGMFNIQSGQRRVLRAGSSGIGETHPVDRGAEGAVGLALAVLDARDQGLQLTGHHAVLVMGDGLRAGAVAVDR